MIHKQNESGRTMLEMLGVLAIMGVIMYGAIAGIGFGVTMYKVNASFNDLEELSQGIIDLYSWSQGYPEGTDIAEAVIDNDIIEGVDDVVDGNGLAGRFGSSTMKIIAGNGDEKSSVFAIEYTGVPETACLRLKAMSYANLQVYETSSGNSENETSTLTNNITMPTDSVSSGTNCGDEHLVLISR